MTKEELVIQNANLQSNVENLKALDKKKREELSELLGGKYKTSQYGQEKTLVSYSWMEIAFEIGKLKSVKKGVALEEKIFDLREDMDRGFNAHDQRLCGLELDDRVFGTE